VPRIDRLTFGIDPGSQKGIEFGALDNPIYRREQGDIRFVDYTTTEGLRAHPHAGTINKDAIVEVDYVWRGSGSLADVIETGELFDYAIASHVIEHVPNVIGWFIGISEVLKTGAIFNLAIPDKRYTFDVRRKLTTLGELIEAHLNKYTFPSVRQMFDHCYEAVAIEPGAIWRRETNIEEIPRLCGDIALQLAYDSSLQIVANDRYFDSHCLIVTPASFLTLLQGLYRLQLFPFLLREFHPTEMGDFEFFVSFEKSAMVDRDQTKQQLEIVEHYMKRLDADTYAASLAARNA
jgi:hypothetical protein